MIDKAKRAPRPVNSMLSTSQKTVTQAVQVHYARVVDTTKFPMSSLTAWENGIQPHRIAKCRASAVHRKPQPITSDSHGFNTVHGRMPSVTTGAYAVNKDLLYIGVSGDGDSASIGIGQLIHAIRRNMDMVYIVENNGVYGLTKGQYSATADIGSKKRRVQLTRPNQLTLCLGNKPRLHLCCPFVLWLEKAIEFNPQSGYVAQGFALIDVISPCVTFNNNDESMKSYGYVKENEITLHMTDYIPALTQ